MQTIKNSLGSPTTTLKCLSKKETQWWMRPAETETIQLSSQVWSVKTAEFSALTYRISNSNTTKKLTDLNLIDRVTLIKDGHQNMDKYIDCPVKALCLIWATFRQETTASPPGPKQPYRLFQRQWSFLLQEAL